MYDDKYSVLHRRVHREFLRFVANDKTYSTSQWSQILVFFKTQQGRLYMCLTYDHLEDVQPLHWHGNSDCTVSARPAFLRRLAEVRLENSKKSFSIAARGVWEKSIFFNLQKYNHGEFKLSFMI